MGSLSDAFDDLGSILSPSDVFGSRAAAKGTASAERTAQAQLEEARRQFDIGQERLEPFYQSALPALELQSAYSGARGPEAQRAAFAQFQESPATQFLREQGLRQIKRGAIGRGGLGSGETLKELTQFSQGLALQDLSRQQAELAALSGRGAATAGQQAGLGAQFAGQASGILGQQGATIQNIMQQQQAQKQQAMGAGLGAMAAIFSDERLKENIVKIGELKSGLNWYSWDWKDEAKDIVGDQVTEGVIAQEAQKVFPHAVIAGEDGYLRVDYKELH